MIIMIFVFNKSYLIANLAIPLDSQTARTFCARMREHRGDIINKRDTANAMHYNSKGHSLDDFRTTIIEPVIPNDGAWLLEREDFWIKKLETKSPKGLNKND